MTSFDATVLDSVLGGVLRGYCRWQPPEQIIKALTIAGGVGLHPEVQGLFLERCYSSALCNRFPPPLSYRRRMLKALVGEAESTGQDVHDSVMDALSALLLQSAPQDTGPSEWGYKTYFCRGIGSPGEERISLHLSSNMLEGSTGCWQWEAGFCLGQFILGCPGIFAGKRCLELGCGSGLVGICLHRVGATQITLTDGNMQTLANCQHNLDINCPSSTKIFNLVPFQWGQPLPTAVSLQHDVILGSDLTYDQSSFQDLVKSLSDLVQSAGKGHITCTYLSACMRNSETMEAFFTALKEAGLHVEYISDSELGLLPDGGFTSTKPATQRAGNV